jgi:hypothetical protein
MGQEPTIIDLYKAYRQYLDHEHNLINHRLSWNFTIQGFLFTSYAFVANKAADVRVALAQSTMVRADLLKAPLHDLQILLLVIGVVGIAVSFFIHYSVTGAVRAMNKLTQRWSKENFPGGTVLLSDAAASAGLPEISGGGDPEALALGFRAPAILSFVFMAAWATLIADGLLNHL